MIDSLRSLTSQKGFMRYFKNTSWLFMEKVLRIGVGLFVGIWVARYLGPEQFGLLSYAQSFVGLFTAIATLGLDGIVVRELVKHPEKESEFVGTAFWLKLAGALGVLLLLAIAVNFTSNDHYTNLLVFIIASATIFQSFNVVDIYFQSRVLSRYVVYANLIGLFVSSLVKIALILNEAPLVAFAWVVLFDSFVLACGYLYFYFKHSALKIKNLTFKKEIALSLLKDSWPLALSGMVLMVQARIDQVMINNFLGSKEVGYYSVAIKLIESFGFIPMMLKTSLYPAIQNAKKVSEELYLKRLSNFYRLNFLLFLVVALPIFLFSDKIIVILFGREYQPAGILLSLMAIRLFFANMGVARGSFILTENLTKFSLLTMILGTMANILLNYIWIPTYGSEGAIVATIISLFITTYAIDLLYSRTRKNVLLQLRAIFTCFAIQAR